MKTLLPLLLILPLTLVAQDVTVTRDEDGNVTLSNPAGRQQPTLDLEDGEQAGPADPLPDPADSDEVETGEQVYTWTDDNGVVHYSDEPRSEKARTVDLSEQPLSAVEDTDIRETEEALIEELDDDSVERQIEEF